MPVALGLRPYGSRSVSLTSAGTANTLTKWTGASTIGNSSITDTGSLVTCTVPITLNTALAVTSGGTGATSFTKGDIAVATATNVLGSLADVAVGQVLTSGGTGTVPAWSNAPTITSLNLAGTSNQIVLQSAGVTGTITATPTSSNKTYTFPNASITVNAAADISGTTLASNVVTSSLTAVGALASGSIAAGFGTIATANTIGTTSTLTGAVKVISKSDSYDFAAGAADEQLRSASTMSAAAKTYTLDAATVGKSHVFVTDSSGSNGFTVVIDPTAPGTDRFVRLGTEYSSAVLANTAGTTLSIVCMETGHWSVIGENGTITFS